MPMLQALNVNAMTSYGSIMRFRHAGSFAQAEMAYALRTQDYPLLMVGDLLRYFWNNENGEMPISTEETWEMWRRQWGFW